MCAAARCSPPERQGERDQTLVYGTDGRLAYVGPTGGAPKPAPSDTVLDYSQQFVMPG